MTDMEKSRPKPGDTIALLDGGLDVVEELVAARAIWGDYIVWPVTTYHPLEIIAVENGPTQWRETTLRRAERI